MHAKSKIKLKIKKAHQHLKGRGQNRSEKLFRLRNLNWFSHTEWLVQIQIKTGIVNEGN
jgi:hypothetical protein